MPSLVSLAAPCTVEGSAIQGSRAHSNGSVLASVPWFPDLLVAVPVSLPLWRDLLRQPHFHRFHQNLHVLRLTAFPISSDPPAPSASIRQWLISLPAAGESLRMSTTRQNGLSTVPGVIIMAILSLVLPSRRLLLFSCIFAARCLFLSPPLLSTAPC